MKNALLFITVFFISNIVPGRESQNKQPDSLFTSLFNKKRFNGNVLIADKGQTIFEKSYGFADEETRRKPDNHTIFELASVSKAFTATRIVLLEKRESSTMMIIFQNIFLN